MGESIWEPWADEIAQLTGCAQDDYIGQVAAIRRMGAERDEARRVAKALATSLVEGDGGEFAERWPDVKTARAYPDPEPKAT